jgi:hypothetical protein
MAILERERNIADRIAQLNARHAALGITANT